MNRYTEEEAKIRYLEFFKANPPAVILAKGLEAPQSMVDAAKQTGIPLLTTTENTSTFISSLILFLNTELAPRLTRSRRADGGVRRRHAHHGRQRRR